MTNNTLVLIAHFDYSDSHEYIVYRIKEEDVDKARAIIEQAPETWRSLDDDCWMTYEDVIDRAFTKANIWFDKNEYDVVRIVDC